METHYFRAADGLALVGKLASDGVPFKFMTKARRPMQFINYAAADCAIVLSFVDAESNRAILSMCSVGAE